MAVQRSMVRCRQLRKHVSGVELGNERAAFVFETTKLGQRPNRVWIFTIGALAAAL
jgi:hypothetical protein